MERKIGNIYGFTGGNYAGNVYDKNYMAPTLNTMQGGGKQPMILEDAKVVGGLGEKKSNGGTQYFQQDRVYYGDIAMCHPSQIPGGSYNYSVEENVYDFYNNAMKSDGVVGTITTGVCHNGSCTFGVVETVKIKQATRDGYIECKIGGVADLSFPSSNTRRGRVQDMGDVCPTLMSGESGVHRIESVYRIRKLTPKECWRLMDFSDDDFHKAEQVNSNTQLYKQAGNSIVKNVLVAIFGQMIPGKENIYKERY